MANTKPDRKPAAKSRTGILPAEGKMLGRKLPYDLEIEQAVLGALMLEKEAVQEVMEILKPDSFYKEAHSSIFSAIQQLFLRSEAIDLLTVTSQLRAAGELELAGGAYYITQLTHRVNSAANIVFHARILVQHAIKRELIRIANEIIREAYEDTSDVFEVLDQMEAALFEVSEMNIRKNYAEIPDVLNEVMQEMEAMRQHKDGLTGVPSGFTELDRVTSGWQKSDLVIIAARPGMGKTAFILSALRNAAVGFQKPVAIFSLEMSSAQLVKRLISAEAELESQKLKTGKMTDEEWGRFVDKAQKLSMAPFYIDDTPAISVLELRAKCRRLKAQKGIELVVIDYLQLMTSEGKNTGNREQEIAHISRSLKQLAKELNIPVIALAQLSRAVEMRSGDKKPQLSDLRESGSIEQDADMVMFLYRPEYYGITADEDNNPVTNMGEVILAKHRNGSLENVRLKFIGKYTKFTNWDDIGIMDFGSYSQPAANGAGSTVTMQSRINSDSMPPHADFDDTPGGEPPF